MNVIDAEIELMGFTLPERDDWENDRNDKMLELVDNGFSMNCIARASGYAVCRVSDYVKRARERRASP